jgi:hypothetical protein
MATVKHNLTKIFLREAGLSIDDDTIRQKMFMWWKNPRDKKEGGLALTKEGFQFLANDLKLKHYEIPFPKNFEFTTQVVLFLDQFLDCPNYYTKKEIIVFNEKKAAELMLFSGDVRKYGAAKAMARQRDLNG